MSKGHLQISGMLIRKLSFWKVVRISCQKSVNILLGQSVLSWRVAISVPEQVPKYDVYCVIVYPQHNSTRFRF